MATTGLPTAPIAPMLAKIADALPTGEGFLFEPKWDGFRALVFRGAEQTYLQSRDLRPLNRYFPELEKALHEALPKGCVLDGEFVVAGAKGLDFDALQQRIHPAPSRVARLSKETPAGFVAFDLLAAGGKSTMELPQSERRVRLERLLGKARPPLYLTPVTRDRAQAQEWLAKFEGAGLDGVIAKLESATYQPGKRAMLKIKHVRSGASSLASSSRTAMVNAEVTPTWCSTPASSYRPSSSEPTASSRSLYQRKPATTQSALRTCLILSIVRLPGW